MTLLELEDMLVNAKGALREANRTHFSSDVDEAVDDVLDMVSHLLRVVRESRDMLPGLPVWPDYRGETMSEDVSIKLHSTTDAHVWADEWLKMLAGHPNIATDKDTMVTWFANAIEVGRLSVRF